MPFLSAVILHDSLIAVHTIGASICFISGLTVLTPPVGEHASRRWLFKVFLTAFPFLLIPLYLAIAVGWPQFGISEMAIFPVLGLLDLFMTWRAFKAYKVFQSQPQGWQLKYIDHVGFNIISLFAGFVIVLAIDLGAPIWLVVIIAVASIVGGIYSVNTIRAKETKKENYKKKR